MTRVLIFWVLISASFYARAQKAENAYLLQLTKAYKNFMFRNEAPVGFAKELESAAPKSLKPAAAFIVQCITAHNDILNPQFLTLPEKKTLTNVYILMSVYQNVSEGFDIDTDKFMDSLRKADIPKNELTDTYYSMLFTAVGNKNRPFDLSSYDFKLSEYKLTDTEKGIFFLQCMKLCGAQIWGYMNIVKPANTKKAYDFIQKFPKFNGMPYFQFTDFNFPDFNIIIGTEDDAPQSYKSYYIDKYYDLLLSHLTCLNKENAGEKAVDDLLLGSVLRETAYYKYTKNKSTLEELFKKVK